MDSIKKCDSPNVSPATSPTPTTITSTANDAPNADTLLGKISDAGLYSLCGLVAISFHRLFPGEIDR
jgi:hypothetical protein